MSFGYELPHQTEIYDSAKYGYWGNLDAHSRGAKWNRHDDQLNMAFKKRSVSDADEDLWRGFLSQSLWVLLTKSRLTTQCKAMATSV